MLCFVVQELDKFCFLCFAHKACYNNGNHAVTEEIAVKTKTEHIQDHENKENDFIDTAVGAGVMTAVLMGFFVVVTIVQLVFFR